MNIRWIAAHTRQIDRIYMIIWENEMCAIKMIIRVLFEEKTNGNLSCWKTRGGRIIARFAM